MRLIDADKFKQQLCAVVVQDNLNVDLANKFCEIIDMQPTIPIPEKMKVCGTYGRSDVPASYKLGWNACLDEIAKERD